MSVKKHVDTFRSYKFIFYSFIAFCSFNKTVLTSYFSLQAGDLVNPARKSLFSQRMLEKKEGLYASRKNAPLGNKQLICSNRKPLLAFNHLIFFLAKISFIPSDLLLTKNQIKNDWVQYL